MVTLVGFLIVTVCVIGGYILEGGHMHVLFQPIELLIILGAAIGSIVASCSTNLIKSLIQNIMGIFLPSKINKDFYLDLLRLLHDLIKLFTAGPQEIEKHIENPHESALFQKFPLIAKNHHLVAFLCNTMTLQLSVSVEPHNLEDLLDTDIKTMHDEEELVPKTLFRVADALPGLGIVAAVLGIVITMGKLAQGKETIGHSVAAALIGTFLGVLLSYGFFQPLAAKIENKLLEEGKCFGVAKAALLALARGCNPKICIEFARRSIPTEHRPSFTELEAAVRGSGGTAAPAKKAA
ncbi:MAG: flagellar motor stator protein MotA [Bdellovibrionales bacterium GWA2_49_15]|nr:MAG: flagellar motor stator protein MotA [Bdellovibrionales bacterium GWA2_49_15]